jgi:hypothetical protein
MGTGRRVCAGLQRTRAPPDSLARPPVEEPTRRFFRYDPATNAWVSRRQAPHVHRAAAAAVIGGKLYVAGGFNGFDPVTALDVLRSGREHLADSGLDSHGRPCDRCPAPGEAPRPGRHDPLLVRSGVQPVADARPVAVRARRAAQGPSGWPLAPARRGRKSRPEHRYSQPDRAVHAHERPGAGARSPRRRQDEDRLGHATTNDALGGRSTPALHRG